MRISTGEDSAPGPEADQVMHGQLETEQGLLLMASDTPPGMSRTVGTKV